LDQDSKLFVSGYTRRRRNGGTQVRYIALACDYDGTLASHGKVADQTVGAMERFLASGRKLILVTGREVKDLLATFPRADLFEWIVAENGCVLYRPANSVLKRLAEPPPAKFIAALEQRGVAPLGVGEAIVATRKPHEITVVELIRDLGLELQLVFNKDAVMVLPTGINKATGLLAALEEMAIAPRNVAAVGDAENDHAFLRLCGCSAAVANALPALKETADFVTQRNNGAGVRELIDEILSDDLCERAKLSTRRRARRR
jgi:hydroxymethylpyrimidine pyrophosphatase-like HAD family hydrolase